MRGTRKYSLKPPRRPPSYRVDYRSELNEQQYEVVMAPGGPMLVIAGAGSGKTRTVTYRLARLIEGGEEPGSILLLTFTNKAAREMLHRAALLIKGDVRMVWGGTFHHVGNLVLRRHARALGFEPNFTILDREDSADLLGASTADCKIDPKEKRFPKGGVLSDILSFSADTETPLEETVARRYPYFIELTGDILRVTERYRERKRELNLLDFSDLLLLWRELLRENPEVLACYQRLFRHILVDEYQDTNRLQAEIIDLLASRQRNVMVVGDDAQSIYSFRGANFGNIIDFPKRYPDVKTYRLETNYRSTPRILSLANESIAKNHRQFPKKLRAVRDGGPMPALVPAKDVLQQAEFIAQRVLELRDEGVPLNEIAVLYRAHYHSMELQMELTRRGIPFEVRSGLRFFEQRHIKDVTSFLRLAVNPLDELAWKRTLKLLPRVGTKTAEKVWALVAASTVPLKAASGEEARRLIPAATREGWEEFLRLLKDLSEPSLWGQPSEMIAMVLEGLYESHLKRIFTDATARLEDIRQLAAFALQYASVESFLSELALLGRVVSEDIRYAEEPDEKVILSTVHQAKGLEWRALFIIWLAEGRFPSARALRDEEGEEEERRLFYVAATRAKDELYLCYPMLEQDSYRMGIFARPSRFLEELPHDTYESWSLEEGREGEDQEIIYLDEEEDF